MKNVNGEYESLLMMQARMEGETFKDIGRKFGVSPRTASLRVKRVASACMRAAMARTQGDPDHPSVPLFTVEQFTADPRAAMVRMMKDRIYAIETQYPRVKAVQADKMV